MQRESQMVLQDFGSMSFYSPWVSWAEMISTFLEAKKYPETLKVFTNTALGESWEEQGHTVEGDPLLRRS